MRLPRICILGLITVATAALGCHCPSGCCLPATPHVACNLDATVAEPGPPDLMRLTPDCSIEPCNLEPLPAPTEIYQLLTASEVQCRAATNANTPNMIELEEHWASVIIECDSKY